MSGRSLNENRKLLNKLVIRLREMATGIPAMDAGHEQTQYFKDRSADVLREWRADRANMSNFWKRFFGEGLAEPGIEFAEKAIEKLVEEGEKPGHGALAGTISTTTGAGALVGGLVGAGAGLAIGILAHAGKSYFRMRSEERNSPYRYLTLLEDAGVMFRSDLGGSAANKEPEEEQRGDSG